MGQRLRILYVIGVLSLATNGCLHETARRRTLPSVAPSTQPVATLQIGATEIRPMYRELLAIDLPTVVQVALARNIDIEQAKIRVDASRGRYESSVEAVFPVIAPALTYQHFNGANQNANGTLVFTNFNNILPGITVQWIVNPGRIYYDIVASKRRLQASRHGEEAAELDTIRPAAIQDFDLVLAQSRVGGAPKAV